MTGNPHDKMMYEAKQNFCLISSLEFLPDNPLLQRFGRSLTTYAIMLLNMHFETNYGKSKLHKLS